jgi:hypothetical protein
MNREVKIVYTLVLPETGVALQLRVAKALENHARRLRRFSVANTGTGKHGDVELSWKAE